VKEYSIEAIRNIGLVGHGTVGKTTLSEAILFSAGVTNRMGKIEDGSTKSDYSPSEISRGISINVSMLHCDWKGTKVNILDTPGYIDFTGEVREALRVVEGAVVVVNALSGVEVGTEKVWQYASDYGVSRIIFINMLGRENASFDSALESATERFGSSAIPLQIPSGEGIGFNSIVDLLKMKLLTYSDDSGRPVESDIPADLQPRAEELREKLIDAIAESDDALLEKYFEEGELSPEEIASGLRKCVIDGKIFPILCGDAAGNIGVDRLLDVACDCFPSPVDRGPVEGKRPESEEEVSLEPSEDAPLSALVFKTISEAHVGELSYFRVYSGVLRSGDDVLNPNKGITERIGQIYLLNGKERREVGQIKAGDMGALVKLKNTSTGDTLCDRREPVILEGIEFPRPVISIAVEPKAKGDEEKISTGLSKLHSEDPSFVFNVDSELKQTIVSGQGELHLEVIVEKLKEKFGVDVELAKPRIPYRETIKKAAEGHHKHKKQTGGHGQYGEVYLKLEPLERGQGFEFVDAITGGVIPSKFIPSVEKGVAEAMSQGVLAGYPVVDVRVTLYFGSFHSVDSSDLAFKIAGSMAFKKGFMEADPVLLEPIYDVEVVVPEEFMGDVIGDLSGRRGKIIGVESDGHFQRIKAQVPLAELHKYSTTLRSLTQGRGLYTMEFSRYEQVPHEIAEKIIEESKAESEGG